MRGVFVYFGRDLLRWSRGKLAVISALVMPAAWLVFVGLALPIRFTDNYLDFITPGILVMTMLTASLTGGALLIFDKILGFFQKFLALPTPRESLLYGKILFITFRGLIQATIILAMAFLLGATLYSPLHLGITYLILFLFGVVLSGFATTVALYVNDHDGYAAFNAMISMPLFFTSSALMPYDVMPGWLRTIAICNPLSFAIDAIRGLSSGIIAWVPIGVLMVLSGVMILTCTWQFRKVTV